MNMLNEKNCKDEINAFTYEDWETLLALIPEIERTSSFGQWLGFNVDKDGVIQLPYCVPASIIDQFLENVYAMPIIIDFSWGKWNEGRNILSDDNFDFDTIDLVTKCKLITAIVRNDRFCEGALVSAFESGLILKILKSIEKEIKSKRK